ncbi:MAG: protein TolA [Candidatus Contendobacter odensis]|uniref:Protein TolA n=1 Tax=Candidatus Contendibacter odensensis TaxID=1400860 RepID=A0A2G6PFV0_9GAMM|nr:MAG: protein TolA [Candidatus Contendobacter odensis]
MIFIQQSQSSLMLLLLKLLTSLQSVPKLLVWQKLNAVASRKKLSDRQNWHKQHVRRNWNARNSSVDRNKQSLKRLKKSVRLRRQPNARPRLQPSVGLRRNVRPKHGVRLKNRSVKQQLMRVDSRNCVWLKKLNARQQRPNAAARAAKRKAAAAAKRAAARAAKRKAAAAAKRAAARAAKRKAAAEAKRAAARAAKRKAAAEAKRRAAAEAKRKAAAEAKRKAAAEAKRKAAAEAKRKAEQERALQVARRLARRFAVSQIKPYVKRRWAVPPGSHGGLSCELLISVSRSGAVTGVKIARSSGNRLFDNSAVTAVRNASPLPMPGDDYQAKYISQQSLRIKFSPRDAY